MRLRIAISHALIATSHSVELAFIACSTADHHSAAVVTLWHLSLASATKVLSILMSERLCGDDSTSSALQRLQIVILQSDLSLVYRAAAVVVLLFVANTSSCVTDSHLQRS
jgi:hypothetical protein